jgi:hypothetical protein
MSPYNYHKYELFLHDVHIAYRNNKSLKFEFISNYFVLEILKKHINFFDVYLKKNTSSSYVMLHSLYI